MVKATQRQMQTMLSEILNELRRRPGRPPQSASTESPATSSWHTGVALPAAQIPSAGSMSGERLQTFLQSLMTASYPDIVMRQKQKLLLLGRPLLSLICPLQIRTLVGNSVQILLNPPQTPRRRLGIQINSLASARALPRAALVLSTITTTIASDLEASQAPLS